RGRPGWRPSSRRRSSGMERPIVEAAAAKREVADIIADSEPDTQVELIVQRLLLENSRHKGTSGDLMEPNYMLNYDEEAAGPSPSHLLSAGRIQLRLWYDADSAQLTVSLLCAFGLMPLMDDQLANAFVLLTVIPLSSCDLNDSPVWYELSSERRPVTPTLMSHPDRHNDFYRSVP
uniref:C2 PI3K-type domain-containing protein n=1 Tax=Macrostomum lignano TaxID=282301 RepID=A0A1I8FSP8_9PLAT